MVFTAWLLVLQYEMKTPKLSRFDASMLRSWDLLLLLLLLPLFVCRFALSVSLHATLQGGATVPSIQHLNPYNKFVHFSSSP
jgi:hypothetical protein